MSVYVQVTGLLPVENMFRRAPARMAVFSKKAVEVTAYKIKNDTRALIS